MYQIFSNETVSITLTDPQQINMKTSLNTTKFKHSFTTFEGGHYSICIENIVQTITTITYLMKNGIAAKDYSQIAKKKDLKPFELNVSFYFNDSCKSLTIKVKN